ncbi:uncharacterized protein PV07_05894 [Cladophialophora immunda]|uniref:Uncharacterized protein n=1 Tax=Cladophialophora immunda TaxID=569365 RepID=A0A0D1ZQ41_9EURO|nr:uncharacterized protein PV07_05894 [Cladophialophora immunda]KIW30121.1 hypothetical protein PV07_05894 [Cladophialophora immunda]OQV08986.1 hypothetical protein CLAIMM_13176 [Cladophialophora immunda]
MTHLTHPWMAIRRPRNLKRQRWVAGVGFPGGIRQQCSCGKPHSRNFDLCLLFPRHRFGSSRFNTVFLLLFRLFYHASSFEVAHTGYARRLYLPLPPETVSKPFEEVGDEKPLIAPNQGLPNLFKNFRRFSTTGWLDTLLQDPAEFKNLKVNSITWIKALASPFSHEFIQFIVEDSVSGQRTRVAAGREETGDWVLVGWNWALGDTPSDHYNLPLPLLTVTFDDVNKRPDLRALAYVLSATTEKHPAYKFRREMCWWYAETVLEVMHEHFGGKVKEWEWSRYRYSFIVKTSFIRRRVLTMHAELFKRQLAEEMSY